jgi:succinoglycan biosynthesis protein ExoH
MPTAGAAHTRPSSTHNSGGVASAKAGAVPLTELDRRRISWLRLVLVLALVFLHYGGVYGSDLSPYRGYQGQDLPVASILISFILYIGFTAVPAMSAISGYLFFDGATPRRAPNFARKMRRRVESLVLPFLLWGTGLAIVGYLAHLAVPSLFGSFFDRPGANPVATWLNAAIGITRTPLAFQLWFVHDLIVAVAISPLVWLLIGRLPWLTIAVLVPLWILDVQTVIFHRLDVLTFFCFGAACAMHGIRPDLPRRAILPVFGLFLAVALARTVAPYFVGRIGGLDFDIATAAMRVLGAVAVWNVAALLLEGRIAEWVLRNSYMAFFIHCAHYPLILFLKLGLGSTINPASEVTQILLYLVSVALTISGCVAAGHLLSRVGPKAFRILSGGRTRPGAKTEVPGFLPTA